MTRPVFPRHDDTPATISVRLYLATECTDARWPRSWPTWQLDDTEVARDAP
jgi:hypothetical protein